MSGLRPGGTYELTSTKALYWHNGSGCPCGSTTLHQLWVTHLQPRGWKRLPTNSHAYLHLVAPPGTEDISDAVYEDVIE